MDEYNLGVVWGPTLFMGDGCDVKVHALIVETFDLILILNKWSSWVYASKSYLLEDVIYYLHDANYAALKSRIFLGSCEWKREFDG
jgi:hypothetical protein